MALTRTACVSELHATGKNFCYGLVTDVPLHALVIDGAPSLISASIRLANAENDLVSPFCVAAVRNEKNRVPVRALWRQPDRLSACALTVHGEGAHGFQCRGDSLQDPLPIGCVAS